MSTKSSNRLTSLFITIISGIRNFFVGSKNLFLGTLRFFAGLVNLVRTFAQDNFERIVKAIFLFLALLLIQFNLYISVLLACGYLIYEAHLYIADQLDALKKEEVIVDQKEKQRLMEESPGFFTHEGVHSLKIFERLSREVYAWFREHGSHRESKAFVKYFNDLGYDHPEGILEAVEHGIKTAFARNEKENNLLVLTAGTDFFEFGPTMIEDLDNAGPGRKVFEQNKEKIIGKIVEASEGLEYINLSGHSFGGSISMMIAVELMKEIKEGRLAHVKGINLSIYQSSGVNQEVADQAKEYLGELREIREDFKFNMVAHFHDFDPIPGSGVQILGDYEGDNANVYMVRRLLTFWSFLIIIASPFGIMDLAHTGDIYDQEGSVDKHDFKRDSVRDDSGIQFYENKNEKDYKEIKSRFLATPMKFICNGSVYTFFRKHKPLFWKTLIVGLVFAGLMLGLVFNLGYLLFFPGILNFYNFYRSLLPVFLSGYYFNKCYKEFTDSMKKASASSQAGNEKTPVPAEDLDPAADAAPTVAASSTGMNLDDFGSAVLGN